MDHVRYTKDGHVAYVTLDRPEVLNAMNLRMHEELAQVWDDVERDDDVRVAVLTGAGDRAFSVGQDITELVARTERGEPPTSFGSVGLPGWPRITQRFEFAKPLIAQVNGYAVGGGCELALACDVVIAAEHATFALPEARLGLIPGAGGAFRLTRQIPYRVAMGHLLTGRDMTAGRAYELGLVNQVVPADELSKCTDEWVGDLLRCSPLSVRAIKNAAAASAHLPLEEAFRTRYAEEERRLTGADTLEGPRAFIEKRAPRWSGR